MDCVKFPQRCNVISLRAGSHALAASQSAKRSGQSKSLVNRRHFLVSLPRRSTRVKIEKSQLSNANEPKCCEKICYTEWAYICGTSTE